MKRKRAFAAQRGVNLSQLVSIRLLVGNCRRWLFSIRNSPEHYDTPVVGSTEINESTDYPGIRSPWSGTAHAALMVAGRTRTSIEHRPKSVAGVASLVSGQPFAREKLLPCRQAFAFTIRAWTSA
jgi:hypothetical protein